MQIIPAATAWVELHQLDAEELTCSAAQARRRWTAEGVFARVVNCPALKNSLPHHFLTWADAAQSVAYLSVLLQKFALTPVGWDECVAAMGPAGGGDGAQ